MKKILLMAVAALLTYAPCSLASDKMTDQEMIKTLQRIFSERPDLIINVLRENSELVLDIAQEGSTKRRKRSLLTEWRKDMQIEKNVKLDGRPVLGPKDAPITVVEFSDFTCPYCAQAAANLKKIMDTYGNKVKLIFKHTPLSNGPTSILASEYVIAAGFQSEEKAWKLYTACFEGRGELLEKGENYLKEQAKKLELDLKQLAKDVKSKKVKQVMEEDLEDAKNLNVEGTPYFLVNNIVVRGALPLELFKSAFDLALEKK